MSNVLLCIMLKKIASGLWVKIVSFAKVLHSVVTILEPWGILLAVGGFLFSIWAFDAERIERREDRINRAIGQFASGIGRYDALSILIKNDVDLIYLSAPSAVFFEVEITNLDLESANLTNANFSGSTLKRVDFLSSTLKNSNFSTAEINGTSFRESDLHNAIFIRSTLTDVDFTQANLRSANFQGATLENSNFKNANIYKSNFKEVKISSTHTKFELANSIICETVMPDGSICNRDCLGGEFGGPIPLNNECSWFSDKK